MVSLFFPYILKYAKPVKQIGFAVKLLNCYIEDKGRL